MVYLFCKRKIVFIMFKCDFCEKDITPPLGTIIPGDFGARYSNGVIKSLMVRALSASDGEKQIQKIL